MPVLAGVVPHPAVFVRLYKLDRDEAIMLYYDIPQCSNVSPIMLFNADSQLITSSTVVS